MTETTPQPDDGSGFPPEFPIEKYKLLLPAFEEYSKKSTDWIVPCFLVMGEMAAQSDRGLAILATAQLDYILGQAIKLCIFHEDTVDTERIFSGESALGSFSYKCAFAHALGLLGTNIFSDLRYIREIRNKFAHASFVIDNQRNHSPVSFDSPPVRDWCRNLTFPDIHGQKGQDAYWDHVTPDGPPIPISNPKRRFISTIFGIIVALQNSAHIKRPSAFSMFDYVL